MLGAMKILARLREDVVALVYPPQCLLCLGFEVATHCRFLCENCWQHVQAEPIPPPRNWRVTPPTAIFAEDCEFDFAAWPYRGAMSVLIPTMKYRDHPSFAKIFAALAALRMREQLALVLPASPVLIPVPLHPRRLRERGFNQSLLLAQVFAKLWNLETWPRAIRRVKFTDSQASLSALERKHNVTDAFASARDAVLHGRTVILVDDVITTGATISACARVAKQAGATRVVAIALSRSG